MVPPPPSSSSKGFFHFIMRRFFARRAAHNHHHHHHAHFASGGGRFRRPYSCPGNPRAHYGKSSKSVFSTVGASHPKHSSLIFSSQPYPYNADAQGSDSDLVWLLLKTLAQQAVRYREEIVDSIDLWSPIPAAWFSYATAHSTVSPSHVYYYRLHNGVSSSMRINRASEPFSSSFVSISSSSSSSLSPSSSLTSSLAANPTVVASLLRSKPLLVWASARLAHALASLAVPKKSAAAAAALQQGLSFTTSASRSLFAGGSLTSPVLATLPLSLRCMPSRGMSTLPNSSGKSSSSNSSNSNSNNNNNSSGSSGSSGKSDGQQQGSEQSSHSRPAALWDKFSLAASVGTLPLAMSLFSLDSVTSTSSPSSISTLVARRISTLAAQVTTAANKVAISVTETKTVVSTAAKPSATVQPSTTEKPTPHAPVTKADAEPGSIGPTSFVIGNPKLGFVGSEGDMKQSASQHPSAKLALNVSYACVGKRRGSRSVSQAETKKIWTCDCGEDAFFTHDSPAKTVLGIADGVGGWVEMDVDPSLFAWTLMNNCKYIASKSTCPDTPKQLLARAFSKLVRDKTVAAGSSTACVAMFDKTTAMLQTTNLGDSGFLIIRDGKVLIHSEEQQHFFNAPYQLAVVPPSMGNLSIRDAPSDAMDKAIQLKENDIVMFATDGLFDNLFDEEMVKVVETLRPEGPRAIARGLSVMATHMAYTRKGQSPFGVRGNVTSSGKPDDVTIIIAQVVPVPTAPTGSVPSKL